MWQHASRTDQHYRCLVRTVSSLSLAFVYLAGGLRPVKLLTQIHDELLVEVNTGQCDFYQVAGEHTVSRLGWPVAA